MADSEDSPATRRDLERAVDQLRLWLLEREVMSLRWFVGTQLAYFAVTLGAVWVLIRWGH
jgi:hypothetical protein